MVFTITDFEDLLRLLSEHPEWQARLRPVILGGDLLEIPSRMDRVEAALERLSRETTRLSQETTRLTAAVQALVERQDRVEGELGNIRGELLEARFERNLGNWLREWVRRPHRVQIDDLSLLEAAIASGEVSEDEANQVAALDFLVHGQERTTAGDVLLAVEVSQTVNVDDVKRASTRAAILRKAGYEARAMVTGNRITEPAGALAAEVGAIVALVRPAA